MPNPATTDKKKLAVNRSMSRDGNPSAAIAPRSHAISGTALLLARMRAAKASAFGEGILVLVFAGSLSSSSSSPLLLLLFLLLLLLLLLLFFLSFFFFFFSWGVVSCEGPPLWPFPLCEGLLFLSGEEGRGEELRCEEAARDARAARRRVFSHATHLRLCGSKQGSARARALSGAVVRGGACGLCCCCCCCCCCSGCCCCARAREGH
jgi:hypothetical protein